MPSPFAGLSVGRARRFDDFLDGLAAGVAEPPPDLDPVLAAAARRLHAVASVVPRGGTTGTHSPIAAAPSRVAFPRRRAGLELRRSWAGLQLGATALLLLSLFGVTFALASRQAGRQGDAAANFDLYRMDRFGQIVSALDPLTLEDLRLESSKLATPEPRATPGLAGGIWTATVWVECTGEPDVLRVDFLMMVDAGAQNEVTRVIRDGRSGEEIARFHDQDAAYITDVSDGCDRLVLPGGQDHQPRWYLFDTATGLVVATAGADNLMPISGFGRLDPTGRRLYLLVYGGNVQVPDASDNGPYPVRLASIDLETGTVTTSEDLPGIVAGVIASPELCATCRSRIQPQLVRSPDGSTLAVVAGSTETVVLVDAADLSVIGLIDMFGGGPATPIRGAATVSGTTVSVGATWQEVREAGPDGNRVPPEYRDIVEDYFSNHSESRTVNAEARAVFALDGGSLYVSGYEALAGPDGSFIGARYYSIRRIDLETGQVSAIAAEGANQLVASPDGRWLYALGNATGYPATCNACPQTLRRLDAETLATEAERTLPPSESVLILPRQDPA